MFTVIIFHHKQSHTGAEPYIFVSLWKEMALTGIFAPIKIIGKFANYLSRCKIEPMSYYCSY